MHTVIRRNWHVIAIVAVVLMGAFSPFALHATEQPKTVQALQSAATTGNGTTFNASQCRETAAYIRWSTGVNAGAVTVETADDMNYTGTWAPLAVINWSAANKQDVVQVTGVMLAMRTRISTNITGGTVTTTALCN